ncbi:unnamed protein product [Knipowitschia caucasica]|uniref:HMG box domain-containing protein n=1 Tax=Knipowitschia caucasica TaxID=637954 RepID=A0AAV2JXN4_KNICA
MNGSSSVSATGSTEDWSQEDVLELLDRIRTQIPDGDTMKYKTTESHFDWTRMSFGRYSATMCKDKWSKVSTEVRKYRTMTELLIDAVEFVKNPYKGKKLKTHPDFPKKPLTPYFRFFMEKRAKYAKIHPEMSNLDLTKILSKKYKELPEKKKQKYITEFQREKEAFEKNMARFKEDHPDLMEERKKSELPEKPKTPQQLWYNHEKKGYTKLHPQVSQKELKDVLRRQWSQLSDKRRLKWISKALELQKDYEGSMRVYHEAHPDLSADEHVRSVLTKAERQLKDKFDGRPTRPPPNGYSLYCAELMVNMRDVPSTERMVLCSKQWKLMTQPEKDLFQRRCEQRKKQYDVDIQRFLESLPDEERDRVMSEEKLGGGKFNMGGASPAAKDRRRDTDTDWSPKERRDGRKSNKLPETPRTAEDLWQSSVMGDYLAKYRSDRRKAQVAMETCWKLMDKKEKIPWIKKAAEDQKRYERELLELRGSSVAVATPGQTQRKPKFDGEPKKPPVSGYQMFSQELLTNGELNHFSLKERMVEIGKRWQRLSVAVKEDYKRSVEENQAQYRARLELWKQTLSPQERAVYNASTKRRSSTKVRSPVAKVRVLAKTKTAGSKSSAADHKRSMDYRAKDLSDSDSDRSDSSDTDSDATSSDSDDENEDDEDEEDDDDEESSDEESSQSESD